LERPPVFDHKHYVPIIKSKSGELWTLSQLGDTAKRHTTPLLEVLAHKKLTLPVHAGRVCESVATGWGVNDRLFIDTVYLGTQSATTFDHFFAAARRLGVQGIPVTSVGRSQPFQHAVQRTATTDGRGVAIRLGVRDFVDPDTLRASLSALLGLLGLRPPKVDIIIDYGQRTDEAELIQLSRLHLQDLPQITHWRSLTIAAGSFPSSLMAFAQNQWHQIPRSEWRAWIATLTRRTPPPRLPAFGDYGIRDPGAPADFGTPSANLRYASDDYWIVRRGRLVKNAGASEMPGMCRSLLERPEWCLPPFSAGDHEIARIAASQDSTGNATQWVQWCMSHHFEFVVDQILNHREL
jgi:hypothetical protein